MTIRYLKFHVNRRIVGKKWTDYTDYIMEVYPCKRDPNILLYSRFHVKRLGEKWETREAFPLTQMNPDNWKGYTQKYITREQAFAELL